MSEPMWPWCPDTVLPAFDTVPGYVLRQLRLDDLPTLLPRLADWYPAIRLGAESVHLEPEFYQREVFTQGADPHRPVLSMIAEAKDRGEPVALLSLEQQPRSRTLYGRLGAVDPAHRSAALGVLGPRLLEAFGRAMGAELLQYYATLATKHQQVIAERLGYRLVGILPAHDRAWVDGVQSREHDALYAKVLLAAEHCTKPRAADMTAQTRALYKHLFGDDDGL